MKLTNFNHFQIFIPILSEEGAKSEKFNDELSLAYVANKSIVPVARQNIRKVNPNLNSGVYVKIFLFLIWSDTFHRFYYLVNHHQKIFNIFWKKIELQCHSILLSTLYFM